MLEDRDYMRAGSRRMAFSATQVLTVAMAAVFVLQLIYDQFQRPPVETWLALTEEGLRHGWLWQLLTFQFLHDGVLHVACNLIAFWWLGSFLENVLGRRRFLIALFGSGVAGGILQGALMLAAPSRFGTSVVGASAGVSGLLAIFALLERNSTIRLSFIVPIRAITLLYASVAISLLCILVPSIGGNVAHAAHLGGLLAGVAWVKLGWHRDFVRLPWEGLLDRWRQWRPLKVRQRKRELIRAASVRGEPWRQASMTPPADLPADEFISKEVDPILEKISAHGIQSLTEREKRILESARHKIQRR